MTFDARKGVCRMVGCHFGLKKRPRSEPIADHSRECDDVTIAIAAVHLEAFNAGRLAGLQRAAEIAREHGDARDSYDDRWMEAHAIRAAIEAETKGRAG